jgi:hypothetical protein
MARTKYTGRKSTKTLGTPRPRKPAPTKKDSCVPEEEFTRGAQHLARLKKELQLPRSFNFATGDDLNRLSITQLKLACSHMCMPRPILCKKKIKLIKFVRWCVTEGGTWSPPYWGDWTDEAQKSKKKRKTTSSKKKASDDVVVNDATRASATIPAPAAAAPASARASATPALAAATAPAATFPMDEAPPIAAASATAPDGAASAIARDDVAPTPAAADSAATSVATTAAAAPTTASEPLPTSFVEFDAWHADVQHANLLLVDARRMWLQSFSGTEFMVGLRVVYPCQF